MGQRIWFFLQLFARKRALAYAGFDHVHACLTLRTHVVGQKTTLPASLKHKIAVKGFQTLTKHVLNPENTFQGFPMVEFTPLEVSTWIKMLGSSFEDALIPLGFSCISFYLQIKVDEPRLCESLSFGSLLNMFSNSMVWKYALLLKNLVQSWANLMLVLSSFPLLTKISLTCLINSWVFLLLWLRDCACSTSWISTWFSHTFLRGMFLWLGCSTFIISIPSAYAFLWGIFWCMRLLV